jgi:hypothetical protein
MNRKITVPAGIGDNIWLLMKLINTGEKFDFQLPDGKPQRGKQIFDLLPGVSASCEYVPNLTYKKLAKQNIQNKKKNWKDISEKSFSLSMNEHLEQGNRIEEFLPDLSTTFKINWDTNIFTPYVEQDLPNTSNYIGLYGSSYSTSRAWGFWDEHKWLELAKLIHAHNPEYVFVIIGAEWDLDLGRNLVTLLEKNNIPHINTIGNELGYVIELMKRLKYFFSFPSGLGILAPTVDCPVTMFYPPHLIKMMNTWASLEDIQSGQYKGCQFCEPKKIFDLCIEFNKI